MGCTEKKLRNFLEKILRLLVRVVTGEMSWKGRFAVGGSLSSENYGKLVKIGGLKRGIVIFSRPIRIP